MVSLLAEPKSPPKQPRIIGRRTLEEVSELRVGLDFRRPEYRREVFLRFYEFHLENRSHPGCVYYVMPWLVKTHKLDQEQKLWLAFLNGNTQNIVTSWEIFKRFPNPSTVGIKRWFDDNYSKLAWDTDRRYHKKDFVKSVECYVRLVGESQVNFFGGFRWPTEERRFDALWQALRRHFYTFGRLSAFSYSEYLRIMGVPINCPDLFLRDLDGSKSHRNGLAKVLGRDDMDWFRETDFEGDYSEEEFLWLEEEAALLLKEAQARTKGNKKVDPREVNYFTLESAFCTYKSWSRKNRRYPNCLAGNTIICSPVGDLSIKKCVGKRLPVYTLNEKTGYIELNWAVGTYSGKQQTVKVRLDDDSILEVTPDHLFLTKRQQGFGAAAVYKWVPAGELEKGMRLVPLKRYSASGYPAFWRHRTRSSLWSPDHRAYYELFYGAKIPKGYDVHHKDGSRTNNSIENLELLPRWRHMQLHRMIVTGQGFQDGPWRGYGWAKNELSEETLISMGRKIYEREGKLTSSMFSDEYRGIAHGAGVILARWGRWANYLSAVLDNHKVLSVSKGNLRRVYDLSVENNHNFFVAPGVLVHNCYQDMFYERIKYAEGQWGKEAVEQFWECREDCQPKYLLLEFCPKDPGLVAEKQNWYRNTGQVIMMSKRWPEFDNPFDRNIWT